MSKIILDESLRSKLNDLKEPVELCDETGRVLARVTPVRDLRDYGSSITEEELDRRRNSDKWYTTAEVMERLRSLESQ